MSEVAAAVAARVIHFDVSAAQAEVVARALAELSMRSFGEPALRREVYRLESQLAAARRQEESS